MRLVVLGSGGIDPNPQRSGPAYLLSAKEQNIMLDVGPGALRGLRQEGLSPNDLRGLAITHRHPDHTSELNLLLTVCRNRGRKQPLGLAGPTLLDDYLEFFQNWGRDQPLIWPYELQRLLCPGMTTWGPFSLSGQTVTHVSQSIGYRIQVDERVLVYPGDCAYGADVVDLAQGADLLILECSLAPGHSSAAHLNPEQAARIALEAGVGRLLLSHFPPGADVNQALEICRAAGVDSLSAHDGLSVQV